MTVESLFSETPNLPNIPKVIQSLIEQFNDPNSNSDEISKKSKWIRFSQPKLCVLQTQQDTAQEEK